MRIISIIGACPQFMKVAIVSRAIKDGKLENISHPIQETLIHTGQHYDYGMIQALFGG